MTRDHIQHRTLHQVVCLSSNHLSVGKCSQLCTPPDFDAIICRCWGYIYIFAISTPTSEIHLFLHPDWGQFSEYRTLKDVLQTRARSYGIVLVVLLPAFVLELLNVYSQELQDICKSGPSHHGREVGSAFLVRAEWYNGSSWLDWCIPANRQRPMNAFTSRPLLVQDCIILFLLPASSFPFVFNYSRQHGRCNGEVKCSRHRVTMSSVSDARWQSDDVLYTTSTNIWGIFFATQWISFHKSCLCWICALGSIQSWGICWHLVCMAAAMSWISTSVWIRLRGFYTWNHWNLNTYF